MLCNYFFLFPGLVFFQIYWNWISLPGLLQKNMQKCPTKDKLTEVRTVITGLILRGCFQIFKCPMSVNLIEQKCFHCLMPYKTSQHGRQLVLKLFSQHVFVLTSVSQKRYNQNDDENDGLLSKVQLSVLLYVSETWATTQEDISLLIHDDMMIR